MPQRFFGQQYFSWTWYSPKSKFFWLRFRLHCTKKPQLYLLQVKFICEVKQF